MDSQSAGSRLQLSHSEIETSAIDSITNTGAWASLDVRADGQTRASFNDFAEQFQGLLNEKRELTFLLSNARVEIVQLQSQLSGRQQSLLASKEKLIREEYERKFQDLRVEVRQERSRQNKLIEEMKKQITTCICRAKAR